MNVATVPISKGAVISVEYDTWPFVGALKAEHSIAVERLELFTFLYLGNLPKQLGSEPPQVPMVSA